MYIERTQENGAQVELREQYWNVKGSVEHKLEN